MQNPRNLEVYWACFPFQFLKWDSRKDARQHNVNVGTKNNSLMKI